MDLYMAIRAAGHVPPNTAMSRRSKGLPLWFWILVGFMIGAFGMFAIVERDKIRAAFDPDHREPLPVAELPNPGPKYQAILAMPRAAVRKALGTTGSGSTEHSDDFQLGRVYVEVVYDNDRAVRLWILADEQRLDLARVQDWLGIPAGGTVLAGGRRFTIEQTSASGVMIRDTVWFEAETQREKADARKSIVSEIERRFRANHLNATVRADGTVLRIQWVLCDRTTLYQLLESGTEPTLGTRLHDLGFSRAVCNTGYDTGAYQDLTSPTCAIDGRPGRCVAVGQCTGTHAANLCPGYPDEVQCCVQ